MKRKDILMILIPSFIFVLAWISFDIYQNIVTSTISQPLSAQIIPIDPNFDTATIDSLKNRINVSPLYTMGGTSVSQSVIQASPSASPTIVTPTPSAITPTPSIITPTPIISNAGNNSATQGGTTQ